jgi:hypothetical protein
MIRTATMPDSLLRIAQNTDATEMEFCLNIAKAVAS